MTNPKTLISALFNTLVVVLAFFIATNVNLGGAQEARGYGVEPCTTMVYDLGEAGVRPTDDEWDFRLNLIGCEMDEGGVYVLQQYSSWDGHFLPCNQFAYIYAANTLADNRSIIDLEPSHNFADFMFGNGCLTIFEDWSWAT